MNEERRKKTRVPFCAQVVLKTDDAKIEAEANTENISMNGMFVKTEERIPVGTTCNIEIVLPGTSERLAVNVRGAVKRQDESGMGIQFIMVDIDNYAHLRNIILYNAPDPEAVEEEVFSTK